MIRRLIWMVAVIVLAGSAAWAQDPRVEISGTAGWTFSDGVNVGAIDESPIRVDPKDAFSWGARLGFNLTPNVELGFLFASQATDLEASGVINRSVPQTVYNYHGYFAYNFGDTDAVGPALHPGRPGRDAVRQPRHPRRGDRRRDPVLDHLGGRPQALPGQNFGIRLEARWTPTYIKTDPEGYWCDPYWGCYTVGDAEYSNQFELSGGIILRF